MKHEIALPEQLRRKALAEDRLKEVENIRRNRQQTALAVGASSGLLGAFILPEAKKHLSWHDDETRGSLVEGIIVGAFGAAVSCLGLKTYDKMVFEKRAAKIQEDIAALEKQATDDYIAIVKSYEAIFNSFVDGFVAEAEIYHAAFAIDSNLGPFNRLKEEQESLGKKVEEAKNKVKDIEKKIFDLQKEAPEENVSNVDLPAFPGAKKSDRQKLADELNEWRDKQADLTRAYSDTSKALSEARGAYVEAQRKLKSQIETYPITLANRASRELFYEYFAGGIEGVMDDVRKLSGKPKTMAEVIYIEKALKELKRYHKNIEVNYEEFVADVDGHMKDMLSASGRMKRKRATDMTYGSAPFYKVFQTFVDMEAIAKSPECTDSISEIIDGAQADVVNGEDEGTWLAIKNYSSSWLHTVGDFSDIQADELTEYLKEYLEGEAITVNSNLDKINKAYKQFVKKTHADNLGDVDVDFKLAEVSTLMKAYRKYHESYAEIFKGGGSNGTTSKAEI